MRDPVMLSLCDLTTTMCRPWAAAGFTCYAVDLQHPEGEHEVDDNIIRVGADIMSWLPPRDPIAFVAAFPPCTNLAVSGARWFRSKGLAGLADGLLLIERCAQIAEWSGAPWMLENPISVIKSYWRDPDFYFDPYEYGGYLGGHDDGYTKRTCLWTGGGFTMPESKPIPLADNHDRIHKAPPSPDRANIRSATPAGFARAVYLANQVQAIRVTMSDVQ